MSADRVVARAVDSAFRCDVCGERCTSKRALDEHATAHPVTADVQRELAEVLFAAQRADNGSGSVARAEMLAAALLPTVQALIADAEKRAAAGALRTLRARLAVCEDAPTDAALEGLDFTLRVLADQAAALDPT